MEVFTVVVRDPKNTLIPITGVVAAGRDAAIERALEIAKGQGVVNPTVWQVQPEGVSF